MKLSPRYKCNNCINKWPHVDTLITRGKQMTKEEISTKLYDKYGSFLLSRKQAAQALNKSVATLDRWKQQGLYLEFKKLGKSKNATVEYPINTIVDYIFKNNQKVV